MEKVKRLEQQFETVKEQLQEKEDENINLKHRLQIREKHIKACQLLVKNVQNQNQNLEKQNQSLLKQINDDEFKE